MDFPDGFFEVWTEAERERWTEGFLRDAWRDRRKEIPDAEKEEDKQAARDVPKLSP